MMLILRLYPMYEIDKVWDFVEERFAGRETRGAVPLFVSHQENFNYLSVVFEAKDVDSIAEFVVDEVAGCDEIGDTRTIVLMKPAFFSVPKDVPENLHRYLISISIDPKFYRTVYDRLVRYEPIDNVFFVYTAYTFGEDDILISTLAENWSEIRKFTNDWIEAIPGVKVARIAMVCRSMRLVSAEKWKSHQKKYSRDRLLAKEAKLPEYEFDWTFVEECEIHGALPDEIRYTRQG